MSHTVAWKIGHFIYFIQLDRMICQWLREKDIKPDHVQLLVFLPRNRDVHGFGRNLDLWMFIHTIRSNGAIDNFQGLL